MEQWKTAAQELETLLRLQTFPLGVTFLKKNQDFPAKTRRPKEHLGQAIAPCQGMTLARRYGWTIGLGADDFSCPIAKIAYRMGEQPKNDMIRAFLTGIGYAKDESAADAIMSNFPTLPEEAAGLVFFPLSRAKIEPDVILVFGMPAQLMRLAHGFGYSAGESIPGTFSGRAGSCAEGLLGAYTTGKLRIALPGNGDRVFAGVQDSELVCAIPAQLLLDIIEGMNVQHKRGVRYPIPGLLNYTLPFPT
ncbi:MAG: DUF169 domain-containing protein [Deltaproteobacteria bacterium]|nr:DUF169 domain-containing protein [Candidatus Zymogenaceae bacterium]